MMPNGTKLKEVNGVAVYVTEDGRFQAQIAKDVLARKNLKDLEREILRRTARSVKVMRLPTEQGGRALVLTLVSAESDGRFRDDENQLRHVYSGYQRLDPQLLIEAQAVQADFDRRYKDLGHEVTERFKAIRARAIPVTAQELADELSAPVESEAGDA